MFVLLDHWILQFKKEMLGRGEGVSWGVQSEPSNTYLVTKANEYNRGELTLHPEQENPGTGMARGGQARANTGVLVDCRSLSASCYMSRQSSLVLSSFWSKRRHRFKS